jgi:hypothetical protein
MKMLLETSLGPWDHTFFSQNGRRINDEDALELIKKECNPIHTQDQGGVLVYMSKEEYQEYQE